MSKTVLLCIALFLGSYSFAQDDAAPSMRVLQFPEDGSIGRVQIPVTGHTVEAVGEVSVPVDEPAGLRLIITEHTDLSSLDSIPADSIHSIAISNSGQHEIPIEHIARFTALESLRLGSTPITDSDAAQLRDLANLHWLEARSEMLTDEGAAHIANLSTLSYLDLRSAQITDAGVLNLAKLEHLRHLDLGQSQISNEGVSLLTELEHLRTLGLQNTAVTPEAFEALRKFNVLNQLYLPITIGAEDVAALKDLPLYARLKNRGRGVPLTIRVVDARTNIGISNAGVVYVASEGTPSFGGRGSAYAFTTDAHGALNVFGHIKQDIVRVFADAEGYVPTEESFELSEGLQEHPTKIFTLRLPLAHGAGGFVVDSEGAPVSGVTVSIPVSGGYRPGRSGDPQPDYSVVTGSDGSFLMERTPRDLSGIWVSATHAKFATTTYQPGEYDAAAFRAGTARFVISAPIGVPGHVVDAQGRSLAGVYVGRIDLRNRVTMDQTTTTDANGDYFLDYIQPGSVDIRFALAGYAPLQQSLQVAPDMEPHETVMYPATEITITAVDESGEPVPDFLAIVDTRMSEFETTRPMGWGVTRGSSSYEVLVPNVPKGVVKCTVRAEGYVNSNTELDTRSKTQFEIRMTAFPAYKAIRVLDAETETSLPSFRLYACAWTHAHRYLDTRANEEFSPANGALSNDIVSGFAGVLKKVERPEQAIVVVSNGYYPAILMDENLFRSRHERMTRVLLEKKPFIRGTLSQGTPSTRVAIANKQFPLRAQADRLSEDFRIVGASDGDWFSVSALKPPYTVFAYDERGFAYDEIEDDETVPSLTLEPWVRAQVVAPAWFTAISRVDITTFSTFAKFAAIEHVAQMNGSEQSILAAPGDGLISFSISNEGAPAWRVFQSTKFSHEATGAYPVIPKNAKLLRGSFDNRDIAIDDPALLMMNREHSYLVGIGLDMNLKSATVLPGSYRAVIVESGDITIGGLPALPAEALVVDWGGEESERVLNLDAESIPVHR